MKRSRNFIFRPSWLVRTSDMQRVPGTDNAINSYCTLSYSWNCSGDILIDENGNSKCIDNGLHEIRFNTNSLKYSNPVNDFPYNIVKVKFEQLIQQVCKDFNIKYIWYDKMCIDQNNKAEKHAEIARMHLIYKNAKFNVALIPEMSIPESVSSVHWKNIAMSCFSKNKRAQQRKIIEKCMMDISQSHWFQRFWTLEEIVVAKSTVYVGRNAHLWNSHRLFFGLLLLSLNMGLVRNIYELCLGKPIAANFVLRYAHTRSTTKEHDRVYALANIFANLMNVDVNYDLPVITAVSNFYSNLIEKDLSVLCFGKARDSYTSTLQGVYDLPSWTGIGGAHVNERLMLQLKRNQEISDILKVDRQDGTGTQKHQLHFNDVSYIKVHPRHFPLVKEKSHVYLDRTKNDIRFNDAGVEITHYITEGMRRVYSIGFTIF
ncbi:heterokaryon incompatibility protein-domain-containing protein [Phascolomyces articulosus]|uniref:Heterokaryon incompatibility protein-domain-containing protein n=1 Tax=Phascolomyces articulosus TaxID=60185 RepID=A0AAD5PJI1_9FUNG|nr:heterokaryon incompatibility protein-domain-containing protein [Phascolomyces articulosus]